MKIEDTEQYFNIVQQIFQAYAVEAFVEILNLGKETWFFLDGKPCLSLAKANFI